MTFDKLEIFADYSQFYLCDPAHIEDWSALWNEQAIADRLIAMTTTVVFGTDRSFTVPVHLHRSDDTPEIDALAVQADHAVVASIACLSGTLKVIGCTAVSRSRSESMACCFARTTLTASTASTATTAMTYIFGRRPCARRRACCVAIPRDEGRDAHT
jgi:hypothetical protein